jgi:hypothetical protein
VTLPSPGEEPYASAFGEALQAARAYLRTRHLPTAA